MRLELELHRANERYLGLLVNSARHEAEPGQLVKALRPQLIGLDEGAQVRAGERPYLLFDFRLEESSEPQTIGLARKVLWLIWHTVRFRPPRESVRLGVPPRLARRMAESSLEVLDGIVEQGDAGLHPRWPEKLGYWRRLLDGAMMRDLTLLQSSDLHATQLLAGELMGRVVQAPRWPTT